jgi:hypothetical protein
VAVLWEVGYDAQRLRREIMLLAYENLNNEADAITWIMLTMM